MTRFNLPVSLLLLANALTAQDGQDQTMPNPKMPEHEPLKQLVGTWRTDTKMEAMPGVPGMEKPTEMVGNEVAELVCDGLWLKVTGDGQCNGENCSCIWMLGYDSIAKSYQCIVASSMEQAPFSCTASYEAKTSTWTFVGNSPMGAFKSVFVVENNDRTVETIYGNDESGKEKEMMRIVRTRTKAASQPAKATNATASSDDKTPAGLAALLAGCGTWSAESSMEMPGAPAMTSKCQETVTAACGNKWTWSNFTGEMMGAPFEGHALTGFDNATGTVTSFWIDTMTNAFMRTDGTYDAKTRTFSMKGTGYDEHGQQSPVTSTGTSTSNDARQLRMVFGSGDNQSVMTINYKRITPSKK